MVHTKSTIHHSNVHHLNKREPSTQSVYLEVKNIHLLLNTCTFPEMKLHNKIERSIIDSKTTDKQYIRLSQLFDLKHNPKISCFSPKHDPIHTHQHFNRMQMHTLNQLTRKNRLLLTYRLNFAFQQCAYW